jgi:hypothetical protein
MKGDCPRFQYSRYDSAKKVQIAHYAAVPSTSSPLLINFTAIYCHRDVRSKNARVA